jgi:hypothetical protein
MNLRKKENINIVSNGNNNYTIENVTLGKLLMMARLFKDNQDDPLANDCYHAIINFFYDTMIHKDGKET